MRRVAWTVLATGLSAVAAGAASARTITGTNGADRITGSGAADVILARGGADRIDAGGGSDFVDAGPGRDFVLAGTGGDRLSLEDGTFDTARCGRGRDIVNADLADALDPDCEVVSRQLSRDPAWDFDSQHETEVEPDSFASGSTIVTAFQVGRFPDGGASGMGWATSRDAGTTWRAGFLPGLSPATARVADPSVTYDAAHGYWLIASLSASFPGSELLVSRSRDGLSWSSPITAADSASGDYDKEWIVCDNWQSSRFRGRCYLSYLDLQTRQIATRTSVDGGSIWSAPAFLELRPGRSSLVNGAQPIVRPNGALVVLYSAFEGVADAFRNEVAAARSTDGGTSFEAPVRVSSLQEEDIRGMRAPPLPSVEIDGGGTIYAAWTDCRFRLECSANDIVIASSRDGVNWSGPRRVPVGPAASSTDFFLPGLAVDRTTRGKKVRLAIVYHTLPQPTGCGINSCQGVDVAIVSSSNAGKTWTKPQRLSARSMQLQWIADGGFGRLLGDYVSASFVRGTAIPVFAVASPPDTAEFRQAIFATTRIAAR